jgi:dynein heavy chain
MEMEAKKQTQPTWETVRYMVCIIMYGGRITDDFDQLLMNTYTEKYFHSAVLTPGYEVFADPKTKFKYIVPEGVEVEQFRNTIETFPSNDSPEIMGLHTNADLTFRTLQVHGVVSTIIDTQPKTGGATGGLSREQVVDGIAQDLLGKTPEMFDEEEIKERLRKLPGGPTQPLTIHLRQEVDRLNLVLKITRTTLKNLRLAIEGTIILTPDLQDALEALFNARIPSTWLAKSWEAGTLGNWFNGLVSRYDQLFKWLNTGRPKAYWLTGFFNPQGFLTAMKQEVNRKHAAEKWALDDVIMTSEVTHPPKEFETLKDTPQEGVYVWGLYLEGCAWSGRENRLIDSEPKKLFAPLPILYVTGCLAKDKSKQQSYSCPTYRVKVRGALNYVTSFDLKTEDHPSKWVLRGVALLCSID